MSEPWGCSNSGWGGWNLPWRCLVIEQFLVTGVLADDADAVFIPIANDGFHGVEALEGGSAALVREVVAALFSRRLGRHGLAFVPDALNLK